MKYTDISDKTKKQICDLYQSGKFITEISKDMCIWKEHIKKILVENDVEIVNYAKRKTPKNAFKKGRKAHNKGLTLKEQYGDRADEIRSKIGERVKGKTHQELHGEEKAGEIKNALRTYYEQNKKVVSNQRKNETLNRWNSGLYDDIEHKFYNVKWYDYNRNGKNVRLQGTWEVEMAKRLDELNIDWICHSEIKKRFSYIGLDSKTHTYKPDFQIVGTTIFIDPHWDFSEEQQYKFKSVVESHSIELKLPRSLEEIKKFKIKWEDNYALY